MPSLYVSEGGVTDLDGVRIGDADTYSKWVAPDTVQMIVNGAVREEWKTGVTTVPGGYMGFGAFTYAS